MSGGSFVDPDVDGHGELFARELGAMIVHVQRETGLAHRTYVLRPWQVPIARAATSRWTWLVLIGGVVSWGVFAVQAARIPLLNTRIAQLERDALRLDTLQQTLRELQSRYEQVQSMLSRPAQSVGGGLQGPAVRRR